MRVFSVAARRTAVVAALTLAAIAVPRVASAQVNNKESAAELRTQFLRDLDTLQGKMLALANAIPADKFAWRPAPGVRSIGEAFMHVASEYYVFAPMSYGAAGSPLIPMNKAGFDKFEASSAKPDVLKHLTAGFAYMKNAVESRDLASISGTQKIFGGDHTIIETSIGMSADLHEHLGQLIAYARMNNITPPWSK